MLKTLSFHSRICMSFAWKVGHFGEISQKHVLMGLFKLCQSPRTHTYKHNATYIANIASLTVFYMFSRLFLTLVRYWSCRLTACNCFPPSLVSDGRRHGSYQTHRCIKGDDLFCFLCSMLPYSLFIGRKLQAQF